MAQSEWYTGYNAVWRGVVDFVVHNPCKLRCVHLENIRDMNGRIIGSRWRCLVCGSHTVVWRKDDIRNKD